MKAALGLAPLLLLAGCISTGFDGPIPTPARAMLSGSEPRAHVTVDAAKREIQVLAGPFHVPAAPMTMAGMGQDPEQDGDLTPMIMLPWPVDAGMAGFRMAAYSSDGTPQPRALLHHLIAVNFGRRQLIYPVPERIFGFGAETPDVKLPSFLEVPVARGDSIGLYAMWNNTTGAALDGIFLQVVIPYADESRHPEHVLPFYFDTNNNIGGETWFDLPPGRSVHSYEFEVPVDGGLLAASGHLHDYGVEVRLEEVATGRVLTKLEADKSPDGHVTGVEQKIYRKFFELFDARIPMKAGVRYRVVGVYDNPTGKVIPDGGMAHMVGIFAPDDPSKWPKLDRDNAAYQADVSTLPPRLQAQMSEEAAAGRDR
jgi:hypothetical protein